MQRIVRALPAAIAVAALVVVPNVQAGASEIDTTVARADCGPGSSPETGVQGQVPLADRESGRSAQGYSCNLEMISQFQGQGQATVGASYGHCQYLGTIIPSALTAKVKGVNVVDMSDPANPHLSTSLVSPATLGGTWETLKVHEGRGLLAAVSVGPGTGGFFVSVYDVKTDCAKPRLLNGVLGTTLTIPGFFPGHEAAWSPDGRTYWTTGASPGTIAALDMTTPALPRVIFNGLTGLTNHGLGFSPDGNRAYVASAVPAGITIFDSSDIQSRKPFPSLRRIADTTWEDGGVTQHAMPFTKNGRPYYMAVDEFASGGARIVDISDERAPRIVRKLKLEINRPENMPLRAKDTAKNGTFGYEAHYCSLDRTVDPTTMACGWTQSGIRVFDISDLMNPREIAYFNPPAQIGERAELVNSAHAFVPGQPVSDAANGNLGDPAGYLGPVDMTADWCMSPPRLDGDRLWVNCDDNGAMLLRFTNGAYPRR